MSDSEDTDNLLAYLYEELVIGDMEEAISKDRARLTSLQHAGAGAADAYEQHGHATGGSERFLDAGREGATGEHANHATCDDGCNVDDGAKTDHASSSP